MRLRFRHISNAPHEFNWYFVAAYLRISVCDGEERYEGLRGFRRSFGERWAQRILPSN